MCRDFPIRSCMECALRCTLGYFGGEGGDAMLCKWVFFLISFFVEQK